MLRCAIIAAMLAFGFPEIAVAQSSCQLVPIHCPIAGGCPNPTSGGKFQRNRVNPVTGKIRNHNGVDYRAPRGTEVRAASIGKVTFSGNKTGFGKTVILRHTDGKSTLYAHLQSILVSSGQRVLAGQAIGTVNSTGNSSGDHLHLQYSRSSDAIRAANLIDPHPCTSLPPRSELNGTVPFRGSVFNNGCNQNVEVSGTLEISLRTEGVPQIRTRLRRTFGPTCFTHNDDFTFTSDLVRVDDNSFRYFFQAEADTVEITFTLKDGSNVVDVLYENQHHFCCTNGVSNRGPQRGTGTLSP